MLILVLYSNLWAGCLHFICLLPCSPLFTYSAMMMWDLHLLFSKCRCSRADHASSMAAGAKKKKQPDNTARWISFAVPVSIFELLTLFYFLRNGHTSKGDVGASTTAHMLHQMLPCNSCGGRPIQHALTHLWWVLSGTALVTHFVRAPRDEQQSIELISGMTFKCEAILSLF